MSQMKELTDFIQFYNFFYNSYAMFEINQHFVGGEPMTFSDIKVTSFLRNSNTYS